MEGWRERDRRGVESEMKGGIERDGRGWRARWKPYPRRENH